MKYSNIFFLCMVFCIAACSKKKLFDESRIENRPESISCTPSASPTTLEQGELTFNNNHLFCVAIEMEEDDFYEMRNSSRFGPSIQDQGGLSAQRAAFEYFYQCDVSFPSYYEWYRAMVEIDGLVIPNVGIRKKGFFGSIYSEAPSLKINTAKYDTEQIIGKTENITFNNNSEDPTRVIQCLFYQFLEWANYPAPRCNLANVSINGEPLGVYAHVEAVDHAFLERNFGNHSGDLYECQLTDFRLNWLQRWESKTDETDESKYRLAKIAYILAEASTNDLLEELDAYINIERFIKFWALEIVMNHSDGYTRNSNNTYVYFDPNDGKRATFIPSGINSYAGYVDKSISLKNFMTAELSRRLSKNTGARALLKQEINYLLDNVWDENALLGLIDRLEVQINTAQQDLPRGTSNYYIPAFKSWIQGRKEQVKNVWLSDGLPYGNSKPSKRCYFDE